MSRRLLLALLLLTSSSALRSADPAAAPVAKPNILLIYVDNVGYGDLGCYGNAEVKTPRIDQLAREGVRCTDFYVSTSSCTPSRGAILSGRHPMRNGLMHQLASTENWTGVGLSRSERIIPQYLKAAGYAAGCFGKWNIGFAPGSRPTERGFDEFLGFRSGNISYFSHIYHGEYDMFRGTERHKIEGYSTDIFADAADDFIRRHADQPWFVYLPFNAVHFASSVNLLPGEKLERWQVPGKILERYGWSADEADERRRYRAMLTALDDAVGRVLDTVDGLKLGERTLVMLISDNGAFMIPNSGKDVASNAPLRDGGTTCYEGGVRVPAIFRWPGRIKAGTESKEMLSHLDILPLCLAVSGAAPPDDRVLDGRNPLPTLSGTAGSLHERLVFNFRGASGLREGSLKIVRSSPSDPWELYDLSRDPGESHDLAAERAVEAVRLGAAYEAWLVDVKRDAGAPAPVSAPAKE